MDTGFENVPADLSRESLNDTLSDEGYSNKYLNDEQQQAAWEDFEQGEEVPEDGLQFPS